MTDSGRWMAASNVLSLFPTFIWRFDLTPDAEQTIRTNVMKVLEQIRPNRGAITPARGWQSHPDLHRRPEFTELVSCINEAAISILRFLKAGYEAVQISGCWANINPPGTSHGIHNHPNNFLSGVYYIQTQTGADTINFHDPRVQTGIIRPPVTELTSANTDLVVVRVNNGTLLVFPAYLQHSVDPSSSEEERISISFNMMFPAFAGDLGKPLW